MGFLINFSWHGKWKQTHQMGKVWEIGSHTVSIVWVFLSLDFYPEHTLSYGKCMCFLIDFQYHEKGSKTPRTGKAWEIGSHTFPIVWKLSTIRFPSCGILHHMRNGSVSPSISHSTWKSNKIYRMGENLENWWSHFSHNMGAFFPLDSHPMLYFITWEMYGFPHQFPIA